MGSGLRARRAATIPRSVELGARSGEVPQDEAVYVICRSGGRSARAAQALAAAGWEGRSTSRAAMAGLGGGPGASDGHGLGEPRRFVA